MFNSAISTLDKCKKCIQNQQKSSITTTSIAPFWCLLTLRMLIYFRSMAMLNFYALWKQESSSGDKEREYWLKWVKVINWPVLSSFLNTSFCTCKISNSHYFFQPFRKVMPQCKHHLSLSKYISVLF